MSGLVFNEVIFVLQRMELDDTVQIVGLAAGDTIWAAVYGGSQ